MAMNAPTTARQGFRQVFGSTGLGALLPQRPSVTDILQQLGVSVPQALQGLGADTLQDVLGIQRQLTQTSPTFQTFFQDPAEAARVVLSIWREFNRLVRDEGGDPVGLLQFVQEAGFSPQIQQMFATLFAGGGTSLAPGA
ncbi:MAG TPA: hypothetical protein VF226_04790 [Hyphomicrobiaceae bacterium]